MRRTIAVTVTVALLTLGASSSDVTAQPAGTPHYPDLITRAPTGLRLVARKGGARQLFFGNTIGNVGHGPLELRAVNNASTGTTDAYQEIYTHTGSTKANRMTLLDDSLVGTFVFHPAHNHWHMADFARYEVRSINPDGTTGGVLSTTDKFSFCMIDTDVIDSSLPHFGMGLSHSCGQNARQGVKVGMGDTYSSSLPDQFVDITGIPDGTYRLVSVADPNSEVLPAGQMIELNDANNAASVDVVITRSSVTAVPGSGRSGIDAPVTTASVTARASSTAVPVEVPTELAYCEIPPGA